MKLLFRTFFVRGHVTAIQEQNSIECGDIVSETLEISSLNMGKTILVPFHGSQPLYNWF